MRRTSLRYLLFSVLLAPLCACGDDGSGEVGSPVDAGADVVQDTAPEADTPDEDVTPDVPDKPRPNLDGDIPYDTLSEYGFFVGPMADMEPSTGVFPYTVAAPLWSDHADKGRFIVLPEGEQLQFDENEDWGFPEGTILVKTFFFSLDRRTPDDDNFQIVETRLLRREAGTWVSYIYAWNDEQTEAQRIRAGGRITLSVTDVEGNPTEQLYLIPNEEECLSCHDNDDVPQELGVITPQLNFTTTIDGQPQNQLAWLIEQGVVAGAPESFEDLDGLARPFDESSGDIASRARAYLHGNCSHCHREGGSGGRSGLILLYWKEEPGNYGICKRPVASGGGSGGLDYDIVPGHPEESIIIFRMSSTEPDIKMPELPNLIPDDDGVQLVSDWITSIEPEGCP